METQTKVALVGLSKRSVEALLGVFKRRCRGRFVLSTPATARVAVFNLDCRNGKQTWRTFRHRHPDLGVVVIGREPPTLEGVEYVAVPLSIDALEAAIDRAAATHNTATRTRKTPTARSHKAVRTSTRPAAVPRLPRRTGGVRVLPAIEHDVYFQPGDYLLGELQRIASSRQHKAIVIRLADAAITVDTVRRRVAMNLAPERLAPLAALDLSTAAQKPSITTLGTRATAAAPDAPRQPHETGLDAFIWHLAVLTARGRVPEGTPLDAPVYLRRWPNFSRLSECADAMRVAAVWVQQPRSLLNLYETLKVPVGHVFTFYTAAQAVGLAGVARRESDMLIEPAVVKPSPYANLIEAVVNRFVRGDAQRRAS